MIEAFVWMKLNLFCEIFQGSKGGVAIRFDLYGESFCFVNAHFTAGDEYVEYRNQVSCILN